ncbi:mechanosensitive ion channel domain-containing protein [Microbacterium sp. NPDC089189]|uniref:mechanosensitive ion channel family protein n=1 Tax=Microbacterium sp. NPDC089189 TaxID=3154972 RepID=UPI003445132F
MSSVPPELGDLLASPSVSGWDLALAAASIVVAWIVAVIAKKAVLALLRKLQGITEGAAILTARIVKYAILLLGVGVAFAFLGASIQPLIAVAIVVVAVIVLALRGVSHNFAAGVVLQSRHPIKVGDEITVADVTGTVRELNGRSVVIVTRDGRTVHVPNAQVLESPLSNHSERGRRRSDVQVRARASVTRVDDLSATITDAVHAVVGVHTREPVAVLVQTVEPERLTLLVRFWHHPLAAPAVVSPVVAGIAAALTEQGIAATVTSDIPVPPLTLPPEV